MKKYLRIYSKLLQLNFMTLTIYRANFVNSLLASVAWGIFSILSIVILTSNVHTLFGWKREEILLLSAVYSIFIGFYHLIVSRNMERFADLIFFGRLDSLLLKPLDSQFSVSLWLFNYTSITRVIIGIFLSFYFLQQLHISLGIVSIVLFFFFMSIGLLLLYSFWFFFLIFIVWQPRLSNIVELLYNISGIARYPQEMYRQLASYIFLFLLPLTLIINTPTKILLGRITIFDAIELACIAVVFFYISRKFWKFALRFYTSASS